MLVGRGCTALPFRFSPLQPLPRYLRRSYISRLESSMSVTVISPRSAAREVQVKIIATGVIHDEVMVSKGTVLAVSEAAARRMVAGKRAAYVTKAKVHKACLCGDVVLVEGQTIEGLDPEIA